MVSSSKRSGATSPVEAICDARPSNSAQALGGVPRRPRRVYEASFKLMVVREALKLPAHNRIKPTCRAYPGVEPVQVRTAPAYDLRPAAAHIVAISHTSALP